MDDDQDAYNAQEDDAPWPHDPNVFTDITQYFTSLPPSVFARCDKA